MKADTKIRPQSEKQKEYLCAFRANYTYNTLHIQYVVGIASASVASARKVSRKSGEGSDGTVRRHVSFKRYLDDTTPAVAFAKTTHGLQLRPNLAA